MQQQPVKRPGLVFKAAKLFQRSVRYIALRTGRMEKLYRLFGTPNSWDWAAFLRRQGYIIGEGTTVNPLAHFMDHGMVTIGRNCSISFCAFVTHSGGDRVIHDVWGLDVDSTQRIVVGDNCIIGCNVTILYGVTIGDNCVIGAGCVITRDVPPGTMVRAPAPSYDGKSEDYRERLHRRRPRRVS